MTSSQTFTVTPADLEVLDQEEEREYSVDVGDAEEVTIVLVDAFTNDGEEVVVDNNNVSFRDDNDDNNADLVEASDVQLADVTTGEGANAISVASGGTSLTLDVIDGVVNFTVDSNDDNDARVIPVVYEGDGDLTVNAAGEPTIDFGIGGQVIFTDPTDVEVSFEPSALRPFETDVTATFTVVDEDGPRS